MMKKDTPNWVGPVVAALILVGGFIAYNEWKETDRESEECARLKALFESNTQSLLGTGAVKESKRAGNQSPMGSIAGDVAANGIVLDRLNAECPGWMDPN